VLALSDIKGSRLSMSCSYCDERATHVGEGEVVCPRHIHPDASGEYRELAPAITTR